MGVTKNEIFTNEQNRLARILKALAHPARIAILEYITKQNACICNDLVSELGLAQPTISQHLRELKSIRIIKGRIDGVSVCYCIDSDVWKEIKAELSAFFIDVDTIHNACE